MYVDAVEEAGGGRDEREAAEELAEVVARAGEGRCVERLLARGSLQPGVQVGQRLERRGHA